MRTGVEKGREDWLLIRKREGAIEGWSIDEQPTSVLSGRTNEEVASHLEALAAHHSGAAPGPEPGPPSLRASLLYARLPAMELDKRARRAALILTGVPPEPEQLDRYLAE